MTDLPTMIVPPEPFLGARSPAWDDLRRDHLAKQPECVITGSADVAVHHVVPVWVCPERELDPGNLVTLSVRPWNAHFIAGHGGRSWLDYDPTVLKRVRWWRAWWRSIQRAHRESATR